VVFVFSFYQGDLVMAVTTIDKIQRSTKKIAEGKDPKVKPGNPERFTAAACVGDAIRQGDLYIVIAGQHPAGYEPVKKPKDIDRQLVPGNTEGAKHCLDSLAGVEIWQPKNWTEESLDGPFVRLSQERTILHPVHGSVTVPAGIAFQCHYQREFDREMQKERRARD
jgi:hypothetical protein